MEEAKEKMQVKYGLPEKVVFCKKCVISNQRPNSVNEVEHTEGNKKPTTLIDSEGVCAACRFAEEKNKIDWEYREKQLRALLDRFRGSDGQYDCVVPGSGGKDSAFVSHILKYKYGMNPLTVTWAPHIYTEIGFANFQNWLHAGFDNIMVTPNGKVHRFLTKLAFENLLHPFQPFIIGQKNIAPKMSIMYGIPLVIYGESPVEYGNNLDEADTPIMSRNYYGSKHDITKLYLGGVAVEELLARKELKLADLNPYIPADVDSLERAGTEIHHFSYYHRWDPQENYYYASKNTEFRSNTERTDGTYSKYSSIDDKVDPFHYYTMLIKFGLGRATYDASQEIRNGKITREEGVALVKKFDREFPKKYFKEFLNYINISEGMFWNIVDQFRSPHLWKKEVGGWQLKNQVS